MAQRNLGVVLEGQTIQLSVSVNSTATPPITYQWYQDGIAIPGEVGPSYTFIATKDLEGATWTVVVTNPCGEVESDPWYLEGVNIVIPPECEPYACDALEQSVDLGGTSGSFWYWPLRTTIADTVPPAPFPKGPNPPVGQPDLFVNANGQTGWGGTFGKLSRIALAGADIFDVCDADTVTYYAPYAPYYTAYSENSWYLSPMPYAGSDANGSAIGPSTAGCVTTLRLGQSNETNVNRLWYSDGVASYVGSAGIRAGSAHQFDFSIDAVAGAHRLGFQLEPGSDVASGQPYIDFPDGYFNSEAHRIGWYIGYQGNRYEYAGTNVGRKGWNFYQDFVSYISVNGEIFGPFNWSSFVNVTYAVTNPPDETVPNDSLVYWQGNGLRQGRLLWYHVGWYHDLIFTTNATTEATTAYADWVAAINAYERNYSDYVPPQYCP